MAYKDIHVANIVPESITDGPGIRFTLFVQGCPHSCVGCHNQSTLPFTGGTAMTPHELFEKIANNPLLSGVTFSGGEPISQADALIPLAKMIKDHGLELSMYTGYTFEQLQKMSQNDPDILTLLTLCDTLVDGPFILAERTLSLRFRGSKNQRILDVPQSLLQKRAVCRGEKRWIGEK